MILNCDSYAKNRRKKDFLHCNIVTNKITLLTIGYVIFINQLSAIVSSTQTSVDSNPGLVPGFFFGLQFKALLNYRSSQR
jgi:hypothetical protein